MNYGGLVVIINYAGAGGSSPPVPPDEMLFLDSSPQLFLDASNMQFLGA